LRKLSLKYPPRLKAIKKAKTEFYIKSSKGKQLKRVTFTCQTCFKSGLKNHTKNKQRIIEWNVDHVISVADEQGYTDMNTFIDGLFCPEENWSVICVECHDEKTRQENEKRFDRRNKI
jgi:hypothetical protein